MGSQDVLLLPLVACPTLAGSGRAAGDRTSDVTKEAISVCSESLSIHLLSTIIHNTELSRLEESYPWMQASV